VVNSSNVPGFRDRQSSTYVPGFRDTCSIPCPWFPGQSYVPGFRDTLSLVSGTGSCIFRLSLAGRLNIRERVVDHHVRGETPMTEVLNEPLKVWHALLFLMAFVPVFYGMAKEISRINQRVWEIWRSLGGKDGLKPDRTNAVLNDRCNAFATHLH
jgi:hypothetical protein